MRESIGTSPLLAMARTLWVTFFDAGRMRRQPVLDIVLLDWNLPKVSGLEVLRALKSNDELKTLPVLVFSSSQDDEVVETAYKGHANGYICKPSDFESLYTIVDSIEMFWVHTARLPAKTTKTSLET